MKEYDVFFWWVNRMRRYLRVGLVLGGIQNISKVKLTPEGQNIGYGR
jgi:hypothetical protein